MNTGADDDSRSTPIFAFCTSSARAMPLAANISKPANASRANLVIPFLRVDYSIVVPAKAGTHNHRR